MSALALGLVLAVAASVALNGSYLIQHVGSAGAPPVDARRPLATLRSLLRSRAWAAGAALGMGGWAMHVAALSHAPLSLVQAFVAGGLGVMAPPASRALRNPLSRAEWVGVAAAVAALALLCVGLRDPGLHYSVRPGAMVAFLVAAAGFAALLATTGRIGRGQALGLAGGVLYGTADVAIKALTGVAHAHGPGGVITSPWLVVAAAASVCAFFAFQRGLQCGRAVPVVVLMTAATTVLSLAGGFVVFGDPLGSTPALVVLHLAAFAMVTAAAAALAPVATAATVAEPEAPASSPPPRRRSAPSVARRFAFRRAR